MRNLLQFAFVLIVISAIISGVMMDNGIEPIKSKTQELENKVIALQAEIEAVDRLKEDKLDPEMNPDSTQLRMIEFQGQENIRAFWASRKKIRDVLGFYIFVAGGGIYYRELKEGEIALVPYSLVEQNPYKDESPVICKIDDDGVWSRWYDSNYDRLVTDGIIDCVEQDTWKKRPNLQRAVNNIVRNQFIQ